MRKKSHISLCKGILHGLDLTGRVHHKLSFYIGSIWPDCIPSFITKRHNIDETFDIFTNRMNKFIAKFNKEKDMSAIQTMRMGMVLHYIADYFTFPHNSHYQGTIKDHCIYEEGLKKKMYEFVAEEKKKLAKASSLDLPVFTSVKQITEFIKEKHSQYMKLDGNVDSDCLYAFKSCMVVMSSLLLIADRSQVLAGVNV